MIIKVTSDMIILAILVTYGKPLRSSHGIDWAAKCLGCVGRCALWGLCYGGDF